MWGKPPHTHISAFTLLVSSASGANATTLLQLINFLILGQSSLSPRESWKEKPKLPSHHQTPPHPKEKDQERTKLCSPYLPTDSKMDQRFLRQGFSCLDLESLTSLRTVRFQVLLSPYRRIHFEIAHSLRRPISCCLRIPATAIVVSSSAQCTHGGD